MTPMRASLLMAALRLRIVELEGRVQRAHRVFHTRRRDVAGDLDRRGGDDGRLDAEVAERLEGLGRDARMALHSRADDADLAEVAARPEVAAQRVQRALGRGGILE